MTVYEVFMELRIAVEEAHERGDDNMLQKCYSFAEWCLDQKAQDLWNAAGVCFYEHLGDHHITLDNMHRWVSRRVYLRVRGLLADRISETQLKDLDLQYSII